MMRSEAVKSSFFIALVLAGLILGTLCYFQYVRYQVGPFPPLYDDQGYYLKAAHQYFDFGRAHGIVTLFKTHLSHNAAALGFFPASNLHMALLAGVLMNILGPSRLAALSIHWASWCLLVITLFLVLRRLTQSFAYPVIALALLLSSGWSFGSWGYGSLVDFRMEFPAACWSGIVLLLWLAFLDQSVPWRAWLASGANFLLIVFRPITLLYWFPPLLLIPIAAAFLSDPWLCQVHRAARYPLLLLGILAAALVIWDWQFIHTYYLGAFLSPAEISARRAELGISSLAQNLLFYPSLLWTTFIGKRALHEIGLLAVAGVAIMAVKRSRSTGSGIRGAVPVFAIMAAIEPLSVLTLSSNKASQVVSVVVPALMISVTLLFASITNPTGRGSLTVIAILLLAHGSYWWRRQLLETAPFKPDGTTSGLVVKDGLEMNRMFAAIQRQALSSSAFPTLSEVNFFGDREAFSKLLNPNEPQLASLAWFDGLNHNSLSLYPLERGKPGLNFEMEVPRTVLPMTRQELIGSIRRAFAVVVPGHLQPVNAAGWPIRQSIRDNFDELVADVKSRMWREGTYQVGSFYCDLYLVPAVQLSQKKLEIDRHFQRGMAVEIAGLLEPSAADGPPPDLYYSQSLRESTLPARKKAQLIWKPGQGYVARIQPAPVSEGGSTEVVLEPTGAMAEAIKHPRQVILKW